MCLLTCCKTFWHSTIRQCTAEYVHCKVVPCNAHTQLCISCIHCMCSLWFQPKTTGSEKRAESLYFGRVYMPMQQTQNDFCWYILLVVHLCILRRHGIIQKTAFHNQQPSLENFFISRVGDELSSGVSSESQLRNHNTMSNLLQAMQAQSACTV